MKYSSIINAKQANVEKLLQSVKIYKQIKIKSYAVKIRYQFS